jgi:GNAT superfamily N-acetyltransferase
MSIFHVREARQNDFEGIAKVRVDTWRVAYKGIVPDDFLESLSYQRIAERWREIFWEDKSPGMATFVAENEREDIVGIAVCGPEQNDDPVYRGEIYILYVLPRYHRQGIGHALVAACVQHLVQQLVVETLLIWTIAESPYRRFYESLGGKVVRGTTKEIGGKLIPEVGYGWEEIHQLAMT